MLIHLRKLLNDREFLITEIILIGFYDVHALENGESIFLFLLFTLKK